VVDAAARDRWVPRPEVPTGTYQPLPVRAGLVGTREAAAELPRAAGHLFVASGYQECEDQPLLELINSVADSAVPVRPRIRPAHCTVWPTCLQPAARVTALASCSPTLPGNRSEAYWVLRPGGRLLVLDTDWESILWRSSDADRMRKVLAAWDEHLADPHLPRRLTELLTQTGFTVTHRSAIPLFNAGYDPGTFSAGLIGVIAAFVPGRAGVTAADANAWAEDLVGFGAGYFFSLNRYLFLASR
jgi:hypothetical protein